MVDPNAVHDANPAGKANPEWWWKKMAEWLEHVDEVDRVHQCRVEWAGSSSSSDVYDPTQEF